MSSNRLLVYCKGQMKEEKCSSVNFKDQYKSKVLMPN